ncbi:MAG: hypothetical protein ACPHER_04580 [Nevskiales bacterium]
MQTDYLRANALLLVLLSTLLLPIEDGSVGKRWFGHAEMLLIAALLGNAWLIRRWAQQSGQSPLTQSTALLCFLSLALCAGGDFINRNYFGIYYGHGSSVRHSYLADSVWLFAPGYGLFLLATLRVALARQVSKAFISGCAVIAAALGALSFADLYQPEAGTYVSSMTGGYAAFISIVGVSALWVTKALGWRLAYPVAIGAVMATIADALIGNFWLYREGYYPAISHVNWILYFASQALVQQLPLQLAKAE